MTREQVKAIVGTEEATDGVMPRGEEALRRGYQPTVRINRKGQIEIGMSVVLREWTEDDPDEESEE